MNDAQTDLLDDSILDLYRDFRDEKAHCLGWSIMVGLLAAAAPDMLSVLRRARSMGLSRNLGAGSQVKS